MSFIAYDQIPIGRGIELGLELSERAAMSRRTISRFFSMNGLPVTEASI